MKTNYIKHKLSNIISISRIVTIHYFEFAKNYSFSGEAHDFWEMVYVDRGEARIVAGKKTLDLKQGEAYFHKPNEFHAIASGADSTPNIFVITFVCKLAAMNYFKNHRCRLSVKHKRLIASIVQEAKETFVLDSFNPKLSELKLREKPPIGGQQLIRCYLEQLLILLIRSGEGAPSGSRIFPSKEMMDDHMVKQIASILENNVEKKISLEDVCREMNYSKTYLYNTFKNATGYSVMQYYLVLKTDRAKILIRENKLNFTQISNLLHYDNPHYFSRAFKKIAKMSPSEYRNSIQNID